MGVCVMLKYYCDLNEVCSFVGLHCNSCIIVHGIQNENTQYTENVCSLYTAGSTSQVYSQAYLTLRLLMSYTYGPPILDVSRSHTTTQHSR